MHPAPTIVFQSHRKRDCAERALVLRALQIGHGMESDGSTWMLWVQQDQAALALSELRSYEEERKQERDRPDEPPILSYGRVGIGIYALVLIFLFPIGLYGLFGQNFWEAGRMDSAQVANGQWWRTITSLTLHADLGHIAANLFSGALFVALTSQVLGSGLAWSAALLSGALGNALTTWVQGPGHLAVGASTGVFGALGVLTFFEWVRRWRRRGNLSESQRFRVIAPLLAGSVLLGFLGTGGEGGEGSGSRVDVLSHMTGFVAGGVIGGILAWREFPQGVSKSTQLAAGIVSLVLVAIAWTFALANA